MKSRKSLIVTVIDVGHGNATILRDGDSVVLIDAGSGGQILEYLRTERIKKIDSVVLSHADKDHVGGLLALLASGTVEIGQIYINADGTKNTRAWRDLAYELDNQERDRRVKVKFGLRSGDYLPSHIPGVRLPVIAPRLRLVQLGPGNQDAAGGRISPNSTSAVIKVVVDGVGLALLPGDLDVVGFRHLMDTSPDLRARYLLVPHHGGWAGSHVETVEMARALASAVSPTQAFVSNGRGKFDAPQPAVLTALRQGAPGLYIACTQLALACASTVSGPSIGQVAYAAGATVGACCAGTIRLTHKDGISTARDTGVHDLFVRSAAPNALCRSQVA